jgi:hypothetical protein
MVENGSRARHPMGAFLPSLFAVLLSVLQVESLSIYYPERGGGGGWRQF